jgi:hypothetical protein
LPTTLSQPVISLDANTPSYTGTGAFSIGNSLSTGQTSVMLLPVNGISTNAAVCAGNLCPLVGAAATGTVWVQYQSSSGSPFQYSQVAAINIKAT